MTQTTVSVSVRMDDRDFERLATTSMRWTNPDGSNSFRDDDHCRFDPTNDEPPNWAYAFAFWISEWPSVMLARAYLEAIGQPYQVALDLVPENNGTHSYVVLTDHVTESWED